MYRVFYNGSAVIFFGERLDKLANLQKNQASKTNRLDGDIKWLLYSELQEARISLYVEATDTCYGRLSRA